jgi:hypothetical protein
VDALESHSGYFVHETTIMQFSHIAHIFEYLSFGSGESAMKCRNRDMWEQCASLESHPIDYLKH